MLMSCKHEVNRVGPNQDDLDDGKIALDLMMMTKC